ASGSASRTTKASWTRRATSSSGRTTSRRSRPRNRRRASSPRRRRPKAGSNHMGTSSARPGDLDRFASRSRSADDTLRGHKGRLRSDYASFMDGTEWGVLDIHSLLAGFGTFIDYNEIDARWVAKIAQAFRHAGGDGQVKTLPDAAIHAT